MTTIHKFPLEPKDLNIVEMPEGAEILSVQVQHETPVLWAIVDTDRAKEQRKIRVIGTGHEINACEPLNFIDTFQLPTGLVFHVFEISYYNKKS